MSNSGERLSRRALSRATLARQMLLERSELSAYEAVERLVGLQAQDPKPPYYALWSRLANFDPEELSGLLASRRVVRLSLMRHTVHMVTAEDCLTLRPLLQPMIEARMASSVWARGIVGIDLGELKAAGSAIVEEKPRTTAQLAKVLAERWPEHDAMSMAYAMHSLTPLVHVPPKGLWGGRGQTTVTTAEAWLDREQGPAAPIEGTVRRYLGVFGPASVRDMQAWCGLTRLREVFERMRPELRSFRDERGVELFDLEDSSRPDEETPAPVRFLPEYDNVLLSHADRSRIVSDEDRGRMVYGNRFRCTFLRDGFVAGAWKIEQTKREAALLVEPFEKLSKGEAATVAEEGARFLDFTAADSEKREVRIAAPE